MQIRDNRKVDVIVIGAGHNGLTAAALLAKQGRNVVVLEQSSVIGGIAAGEAFYPGYRTTGLLNDTSTLRPQVLQALSLEKHGLRVKKGRPSVLALGSGAKGLGSSKENCLSTTMVGNPVSA